MCVKHESITMGLHGNRGSVRSEKHQEVGGWHRGKEKESFIVKIKLRQGFADGQFLSGFVFRFFASFSSMYFFLFL